MMSRFLLVILILTGFFCANAAGVPLKEETETIPSGNNYSAFVPDELLVQFTSPQTDEKIANKVEKFYGKSSKKVHRIDQDFTRLGLPNTYLLKLSEGEKPQDVKEKYKLDPDVKYAEPNYIITIAVAPRDPSFSSLWGLHNTGQQGYEDADIDAPEAWDSCTGFPNITIAVVDTGVDYNHPDLVANMWTNEDEIPENGLDDDNNGFVDDYRGWDFFNGDNNPLDDNGHGTHCSGIIGAVGNNEVGVAGVMWKTKIMALKFTDSRGSGNSADAAAAILYANMMGADVISNSWGGDDYSTTLKNAIESSSALVICAAGNQGRNIDNSPYYPASFTSPQIVAVAATTSTDSLASFSNYGNISVDVAAPGESIYSTLPGGTFGTNSGTSMATPHVAGLAGLLKAFNPGMTHEEVKTAILGGVDQKSSLLDKVSTSGRINAFNSLRSVPPVWSSPGGHTLNSPAMDARSSTGDWFVVVRGTDNHIYFNRYTQSTSTWLGWVTIGGTTFDEPVIAYTGNDFVHVVVRGTDNVLYTKELNLTSNTWEAGWTSLGGHTSSAPTLLSLSLAQIPGNPSAFPDLWLAVRGTDNHLYTKTWTPATGWTPAWQAWGGTTFDRPSLAMWFDSIHGDGILTMGVRGTDNRVYVKEFTFGSGSSAVGPWTSKDLQTSGMPVMRYKDGVLHITTRGTDNQIYYKCGSIPSVSLGGAAVDTPALYSWPDRLSLEVSIRDSDSKIQEKVLDLTTNQWSGWIDMDHTASSRPVFTQDYSGSNVCLAIRGADNRFYTRVI